MGFRDCLISAVNQGAITRAEADELGRQFDERFAQARLELGDGAAERAAREGLERELRAEAIERRRRALLQDQASRKNDAYVQSYRNVQGQADALDAVLNLLEHYGTGGTSSIHGRAKAIVSLAHGQLADVLSTFRRSRISGRRFNKPLADDVVREILGEATGKPEVKAMADAIAGVFEDLRLRFNAAGGQIGKLEGGYLPQHHHPRALLAAGRDKWKAFIRPRLDLDRMKDPLTGERLSPARLEQVLDAAFDNVATGGWANRRPSAVPFGRGALAGQRAEERFLHFRDAQAWLDYNREFGKGDPIRAVFDHINGMARDIAALEVLGPNPNAEIARLTQLVQREAAKAVAGRPSLYNMRSRSAAGVADQLGFIPWRIDSVYQYVRGRRAVSNQLATGFGNVRNLITSAVLGSASVLAAMTDPFIDAAARYLSGLPINRVHRAWFESFSQARRDQVVRSGIILDDFLNIMGDEARYAGRLAGAEWSRWIADRTLDLTLLNPITQGRRHVFARDFEAAMADNAALPFDALPAYFRRTMAGYGIDRTAWDVIRQTPQFRPRPDSAGFIRPIDVAELAEGPALPRVQQLLGIDAADQAAALVQTRAGVRRIAEQYLEMILGQTERAVPSGTIRARSLVTGNEPRGTIFGELREGALQFKSFGMSFMTLQWQAMMQELYSAPGVRGVARGAGYAGAITIGMTLGGMAALQLRNMAQGKDPLPLDDWRTWQQAMLTGGGFGVFGDFLWANTSRFGSGFAELLAGPTIGLIGDVKRLTWDNLLEAVRGENARPGRDAVNFLGRYTPLLSSAFYTRLAYRRVFLDQLQYLLDPEAHRAFRNQESRARQQGQGFWWRPGERAPERPPRLTGSP